MNMKKSNWKKYHNIIKISLIIIFSSLVFYFCLINYKFFIDFFNQVISILQPIIFGVIFAYLMTPIFNYINTKLNDFFKNRLSKEKAVKISHILAVTITLIILILIILLFILLIIPQLVDSITNFINNFESNTDVIRDYASQLVEFINFRMPKNYQQNLNDYINMGINYLSNNLLPNFSTIVNNLSIYIFSLARSVINFLIGLIVTAYCLDKKETFALQFKKILFAWLPENITIIVIDKVREANQIFLGFLVGKLIDSLIIGIICFVGVLLLRMPYPILISVIIGVTNIIPFFGPFLGAIPCAIIILLESPIKCLYFLIFILVLQQFDGNILGPKILGNSTGVSSFWVLFSILLCGGLWGVVGMVIAVPLFAVVYNIAREIVNSRLKSKGLPIEAYNYKDPNEIEEFELKKQTVEENQDIEAIEGTENSKRS